MSTRPFLPLSAATFATLLGRAAHAEEPSATGDRFSARIDAAMYVEYFQRALLPGPAGTLVSTDTQAPVHQYASIRVDDLDAPWGVNSVDVELAAWGSGELGDTTLGQSPLDGDLTVASVRQRFGPTYIRVGRQVEAGGAARFVRFDGVSAGARSRIGIGVDAYGGLTALPRWSERPGYHLLGSAADTLLRNPEALPEPSRSGYWMGGGRIHYARSSLVEVGASIHEEREADELGRSDVGVDLHLAPIDPVALSAQGIVDTDSGRVADARAVFDLSPRSNVTLSPEYLHTDPALLLSRQSVLSVFDTSAFDELGISASWRPVHALRLGASGYGESFGDGNRGLRTNLRLTIAPLTSERVIAQLAYGRVVETENGYHSVRAALGVRVAAPLRVTVEETAYAYDAPIRGVPVSWVGASTVEWSSGDRWGVLVGGSIIRSPYAALDDQVLARLRLGFDFPVRTETSGRQQ